VKKKGQIGMGTTWFPVFIAVIILIIIYIIICGILALFRSPGQLNISSLSNEESVLLKRFSIDGKNYLIYEGLLMMKGLSKEEGSTDKKMYDEILKGIAEFAKSRKEEGKEYCVLIDSPAGYYFVKEGATGTVIDPGKELQVPLYENLDEYYEIRANFPDAVKKIEYYQGECVKLGGKR